MSAPKGTRPPNAGKGRRKGVPNRVTSDVREAISELAKSNVHMLQAWLDRIAVRNPERAADLLIRLLEFHIPKLARSEVKVDPLLTERDFDELTDEELTMIIREEQRARKQPELNDQAHQSAGTPTPSASKS